MHSAGECGPQKHTEQRTPHIAQHGAVLSGGILLPVYLGCQELFELLLCGREELLIAHRPGVVGSGNTAGTCNNGARLSATGRRLCPHFDRYYLDGARPGAVTLSWNRGVVATAGTKPLPSSITIP
jgi:hypothetical protein